MSWLRNSQLRTSFTPKRQSTSPPKNCDPTACTESFKKHWQQASEIIDRTQAPTGYPIQDDVIGVVNHLDQMVTLLVLELRQADKNESTPSATPCFEHLLTENILEKLFEWSIHTGRFNNAVRIEQLKLYELLVSNAGQQFLVHEPFLRPLLRLLTSCNSEVYPLEVEKQLVILLNQLCVSVMQNIQLLDLFFSAASSQGPAKFLLFSLLVPFVHREGSIGQQARDALLLCMSMSKKNDLVGSYIAEHSNVCPVLATGLSGLYSLLPRKLEIETDDWYRLTPDDINELPELTLLINSFEFCNAVAQVSELNMKLMGNAFPFEFHTGTLGSSKARTLYKVAHSAVKEQLLEFIYQGFLIPVMGPALLQDSGGLGNQHPAYSSLEASTVDELVTATAYYELFIRNATNPGLLQTLIKFLMQDCYDGQRILNTLIVRIHSPTRLCVVTLSLLETLINLDSEEVMVELIFKHLAPCNHVMISQRRRLREIEPYASSASKFLSFSPACCSMKSVPVPSQTRMPVSISSQSHVYGLRPEESLYGNYHAYLCDAKSKIESCAKNCKNWSETYDGEEPKLLDLNLNMRKFSAIKSENCDKNGDSMQSVGDSSGYNSFPVKESAETSPEDESEDEKKEDASKSSTNPDRMSRSNSFMEQCSVTSDIGPFLDTLLKALEKMPSHSLYVNLRLTAIISRLAVYPQPLLSSLLLNHSLVFQPSIKSLFQVLASLKQRLDSMLNRSAEVEKLVQEARTYLLQREDKLANMRKTAIEAPIHKKPLSVYGFSRGDIKRRSFSSAISSVLRRAIQPSPPVVEKLLEVEGPNAGYRYIRAINKESTEEDDIRKAALNAVLLDEWLKELAAIAQEHTLYALVNFT